MPDVCVIGLGYIGLPTASLLATNGYDVLGVDISASVVNVINRGEIHIREPGLKTVVQAATLSGRLTAATEAAPADVFIIAVPTPCVDKSDGSKGSDLRAVEHATRAVAGVVRAGNLVILESTSPPGTTVKLVAGILERELDLRPGKDISVAHCPERVLPGHILNELIHNDRVVGGLTEQCAERAAAFYRTFVAGRCLKTDATTAELVKLMENTYRDVNIALANELALIAERLGSDASTVIELANRHPRVNLHRPGPGVGGHCISVDPWFVHEVAPEQSRLIRLARDVNDRRPEQVCERVEAALDGVANKVIAIFGVAYKGNVDDVRETPIKAIIERLQAAGAQVRIYDPHVREFAWELGGLGEALQGAHAVVVGAAHDEFAYLDPGVVGETMVTRCVLDTVNVINEARWVEAGFTYWKVGRG